MTIKEEILQQLRERVPLSEIKRKYRSQSQLYAAIREFLEESDETIEEKGAEIDGVEAKLSELTERFETVLSEKRARERCAS